MEQHLPLYMLLVNNLMVKQRLFFSRSKKFHLAKAKIRCFCFRNSTNLTSIDDSYVEEHFHHQKCAAEKSGKIPAVLTVLYTFIVFCFFIGKT